MDHPKKSRYSVITPCAIERMKVPIKINIEIGKVNSCLFLTLIKYMWIVKANNPAKQSNSETI